jgi:phosphoglycolate phosphatase/pyrophosphatase PpaX
MLKYPCLVLDHDDTAVKSEITVNYPCFLQALEKFRPGQTMEYPEFVDWCFRYEFAEFLRVRYGFTDEECREEYRMWQEYSQTRTPPPYPGIREIILEQKRRGGLVCVASLSSRENILRDYRTHFGIEPDEVYGWDLEPAHRKPSPWALQQIMANHGYTPEQMLVVDDMKAAVPMARAAGCPIAFAGWGRVDFPEISEEMTGLCDFAFDSTEKLEKFLFD